MKRISRQVVTVAYVGTDENSGAEMSFDNFVLDVQ